MYYGGWFGSSQVRESFIYYGRYILAHRAAIENYNYQGALCSITITRRYIYSYSLIITTIGTARLWHWFTFLYYEARKKESILCSLNKSPYNSYSKPTQVDT